MKVDAYTNAYASTQATYGKRGTVAKRETVSDTKAADDKGVSVEFSKEGMSASKAAEESPDGKVEVKQTSRAEEIAEKTNKMSASERKALVAQLKSDQESRQSQLVSLVEQMLSKQTVSYGTTNNIWQILSKGNFTVDAATKAQAQQDISEDGYYGVKETSERLYQFALSLSGGDVDKMKELQSAMEKGYKKAEKTWGGNLPEICQRTIDAANKLFDDYYASQKTETAEAE